MGGVYVGQFQDVMEWIYCVDRSWLRYSYNHSLSSQIPLRYYYHNNN